MEQYAFGPEYFLSPCNKFSRKSVIIPETQHTAMKNKDKTQDYIKAARRGSREAEIEMYGRPLPHRKVHQSRKSYNRKKEKAGLRNLPFDYKYIWLPLLRRWGPGYSLIFPV